MTEDRKALRRIQKREEPGSAGPWKWQLIHAIQAVEKKLDEVLKAVQQGSAHSETARKLSEAGKKSAAARKAKFGSAKPGGAPKPAEPPVHTNLLGEPVREGVRKKKGEPTEGGQVWQAYEIAFQRRWNVTPLRNAKTNAQCKELAKQIGVELACVLADYYVGRDDAFYVNSKHPLGLLLLNLQKINTEFQTNTVATMTDARRGEAASQTDRALRQYAETQVAAERVREQVHVKEVENADS